MYAIRSYYVYDLADMGECSVMVQTEKVPDLENLSPESCYLFWDVILTRNNFV